MTPSATGFSQPVSEPSSMAALAKASRMITMLRQMCALSACAWGS